jgi:RND family efflux transporter MFP subunit
MSQQLERQMEVLLHNDIPTAQLRATAGTMRTERAEATVQTDCGRHRTHPQARRPWPWRVGVLGLTALTVAVFLWQWHRPQVVTVIQPTLTTITESLATTGRVSGTMETLVGAQASGVLDRLLVREGDRVTAGAQLAILKNNVAEAQVAQAQAALNTVRAQFAQVARAPLHSDIATVAAQVRQARAQLAQQCTTVAQAEHAVTQARAQLRQLEAEQDLTAKQYERSAQLAARGFIAQTEFDQAHTNRRVAADKVWAQQQALAAAQANVRALQAGVEAAQANVRAQEAHLQTAQTGSRSEDIQVARARVEEVEHALQVARQQAINAMVIAPFAGTVTAIYAEVGQSVGAQGVLKLVSRDGEIRVDVDESHLADLSVGQEVMLSSSTFRDSIFRGTVSKIAAAVDEARGTVTVTIVPIAPPDWLRPGQTVHVNILTHPVVQRLLVPATALIRIGDRSGVLVIEHGQARQKTVITRPPTEEGVPVLAGLTVHDRVITNPQGIGASDAVRIREGTREGKACLPLPGAQPC